MIEYKHLSPHFKFQDVDPQEKPDVAKQYGAKRINDVIVASGEQKVPLEGGFEGGGISEADVTSAILKVTREASKKVCFVTGHGEKSLDDSSARLRPMDKNLKKEAYTTKP